MTKRLSSKDTLIKYNLGTSANVVRIKNYLLDNEIIDNHNNQIHFLDPLYKAWLAKYYFRI